MTEKTQLEKYEIAIIGAGPAGLQAAIYCARDRKRVIIFDKGWPEYLLKYRHENYLGFVEGILGEQLFKIGLEQAMKFGAKFKQEEVIGIKKEKEAFEIKTAVGNYLASKLLIATGKAIKPVLKGETDFVGKGVCYCVACDAPLFKDKVIGVVGAGDLAANTALELLPWTKKITIFTNGQEIKFSPRFKDVPNKIKLNKDKILELRGDDKLREIVFENNRKEQIDGLFIAIGFASSLDFARELGLKTKGIFVVVNKKMRTSLNGVWAAGDCTGRPFQIAKAVGEGAIAALDMLGMEALY